MQDRLAVSMYHRVDIVILEDEYSSAVLVAVYCPIWLTHRASFVCTSGSGGRHWNMETTGYFVTGSAAFAAGITTQLLEGAYEVIDRKLGLNSNIYPLVRDLLPPSNGCDAHVLSASPFS